MEYRVPPEPGKKGNKIRGFPIWIIGTIKLDMDPNVLASQAVAVVPV